ncbi:MAG: hypothetical protein A2284_17050 [Deltaproteobacteria bacterium RIFOXYA12_FULL_61_11]|nr:MAG: hypothetical protein A2284_17050 [Deltaproteobacteria bacterium RIFOXYA12_FULL_61_11]
MAASTVRGDGPLEHPSRLGHNYHQEESGGSVNFRILFVWFVISHGRRSLLHCNVTAQPNEHWVMPIFYTTIQKYLQLQKTTGDTTPRGTMICGV